MHVTLKFELIKLFHEYKEFNEYETLPELKEQLLERSDVIWFVESELYDYLDEPDMIVEFIQTDDGWTEWMRIVDEQMEVLVQRVNQLFNSIVNLK